MLCPDAKTTLRTGSGYVDRLTRQGKDAGSTTAYIRRGHFQADCRILIGVDANQLPECDFLLSAPDNSTRIYDCQVVNRNYSPCDGQEIHIGDLLSQVYAAQAGYEFNDDPLIGWGLDRIHRAAISPIPFTNDRGLIRVLDTHCFRNIGGRGRIGRVDNLDRPRAALSNGQWGV